MTQWLKRHKVIIWSIIIFAISLVLRFYNLEGRMWWFDDVGRDALVGYHIARFHEFPLVGPSTSYIEGGSYYPPYYYYIIGLAASIIPDALSIIRIFVFFESLTPVLIFFIGLSVGNFTGAIIASILVAVSSNMVSAANLWSPFVGLLIFYSGLTFLLYGKKREIALRIIGQSIMFIAGTIHYSYFIPSTVLFVWGVIQERQIKNKIIFVFTQVFYICILFIPLLRFFGANKLIATFTPQHLLNVQLSTPVIFIQTVYTIWKEMFQYNFWNLLMGAALCMLLFPFSFKNALLFVKKSPWTLIIIFIMPLAGALFIDHPMPYVYIGLQPIILLVIACFSIRSEKLTASNGIRVILLLLFAFYLSNNLAETTQNNKSYYTYTKTLTERIVQDARSRGIENNFILFSGGLNSEDAFWGSPAFWYFLETQYKKKTVHVVNYGENFEQVVPAGAPIYHICRGVEDIIQKCKRGFENQYPEYSQIVVVSPVKAQGYTIYLYTTPRTN
jgi:hypothetical protein